MNETITKRKKMLNHFFKINGNEIAYILLINIFIVNTKMLTVILFYPHSNVCLKKFVVKSPGGCYCFL
jgi:hypothetical protein